MENRDSYTTSNGQPETVPDLYSPEEIQAILKTYAEQAGAESSSDIHDGHNESLRQPAIHGLGKIGTKLASLNPYQKTEGVQYATFSDQPLVLDEPQATSSGQHDVQNGSTSTTSADYVSQNPLPSTSETISPREEQFNAERTYDAIVELDLAESDAHLTSEEIHERIEVDHAVKLAPRFADQARDTTRTNTTTYISDIEFSLGTSTSDDGYRQRRETMTEHEALQSLQLFLDDAIRESDTDTSGLLTRTGEVARSLQEQLTFIGEKEYTEATAGIAAYWKECLKENPQLKIFTTAGMIHSYGDEIKSDANLLDNILEHFSDDELEQYAGRILNDESMLTDDVENTKIVLLDDWTISGSQLRQVTDSLLTRQLHSYGRDFSGHIELQLVAASEGRIRRGTLDKPSQSSPNKATSMIPVRAYWLAHTANLSQDGTNIADYSDTHITGTHSSVDYDFEVAIGTMVNALNEASQRTRRGRTYQMPPLTNIVRPYRRAEGNTLENITRLQATLGVPASVNASNSVSNLEDYGRFG